MKCRCGAEVKQIDLRSLIFPTKTGPRWWWVNVDRDRNLSHQARPDWEATR
jgi:hypothetical protein